MKRNTFFVEWDRWQQRRFDGNFLENGTFICFGSGLSLQIENKQWEFKNCRHFVMMMSTWKYCSSYSFASLVIQHLKTGHEFDMWTIPSLSYKSAGPFEKASWKALKFKQEKGIICEKFPIHDGLSSSIRCLMVSMNKIGCPLKKSTKALLFKIP